MDQNKMGKFISELRKEKNYSQEQLAELIPISRQAVSKWEMGKSVPDSLTLVKLSKIFSVSINEILLGEHFENKEEIYDEVNLKLYDDRNKKNRIIKKLIYLIIVITILFLIYYFFNTYNTIRVYTINAETPNVEISNGIFVSVKEKSYFKLDEIKQMTNKEIKGLNLYYTDKKNNKKTIYSCFECETLEISLIDFYGYNAYFNYTDINYILKNMKLEIVYEDFSEVINLEFKKVFKNDFLNFNKDKNISANSEKVNFKSNYEFVEKMKKEFEKYDDGYIYEGNNFYVTYIDNNIILELYNASTIECLTLNLGNSIFTYEKIENENTTNYFSYDILQENCMIDDCTSYPNEFNKFIEKITNLIN